MTPRLTNRSQIKRSVTQRTAQVKNVQVKARSTGVRDQADHDIHVSSVKFVHAHLVENKDDLLHLITNVVKNFSKQKSTLVTMRAGASTITCELRGKKVATTLAHKVADAFKKYQPTVEVSKPNTQDYYDITVSFHQPK